jgi:hypothetical protein
VTLAHVVEELLAQDKRILLVSTTNAAIDQVLAKLAARPWSAPMIAAGALVRLGKSEDETFGAELADVVDRLQGEHRRAIDRLRARIADAERQARHAEALLAELTAAADPAAVAWAPEAEGRLDRIPAFIRPMAKQAIERFARERGYGTVTEAVMDQAREFMGM